MPSKSASKSASPPPQLPREIREMITAHGSLLLILCVFTVLISFALSLWMLKMHLQQKEMAHDFRLGATMNQQSSDLLLADERTSDQSVYTQTTPVKGLFMEYHPCQKPYVGCDDAMLYRVTSDGTKVVLFPSIRTLFLGELNGLFPAPVSGSHDPFEAKYGGYLVMSPSVGYDGYDPKIETFWLVNIDTGKVKLINHPLLQSAPPRYSSDNLFAAYFKESNGDYRELTVVDLLNDRSKVVARAARGETFFGGTSTPMALEVTSSTVSVAVFTPPETEGGATTFKEERKIQFSF